MNFASQLRTAHVKGLVVALAAGLLLTGAGCGATDNQGAQAAVTFVSPGATTTPASSISGQRFYSLPSNRFARLDGQKLVTVLSGMSGMGSNWTFASPDGTHIAYVTADGDLMITDGAGKGAKRLIDKVAGDYGDHTWSPDGTKLAIRRFTPGDELGKQGVVELATGRFTALPKNVLHPRWSGDGSTVVAVDGEGGVKVLDAAGNLIRKVPGLGQQTRSKNPLWIASSDVLSVNRDGTRAALFMHSMNDQFGDVLLAEQANNIIDTVTGKPVPLPVKGQIEAALFQPNGDLLVRTLLNGTRTVTQIDPTGRIVAKATEPAAVKNAILVSWTS